MRPGISGIAVLVSLLLCTLPGLAQETDPDSWTIERFSWNGVLASQAPVKVTNRFGDVRFRNAGSQEVEISALIQEDARDPYRADIQVTDGAEGLVVTVNYVAKDDSGVEPPADLIRRVDLVMFLPPESPLHVETERGLLEAKGLSNSIVGQTTFGDIVFSTTGPVTIESQHGAISGVFKTTQWSGPSKLKTLTGDIRIELPKDADVEVKAMTAGEITTDYSINIERLRSFHKKAHAKIGTGRHRLQIETEKGALKLVESPF